MKQIAIISCSTLLAAALVLSGCGKKHEDFPALLNVGVPTSVSSVTVLDVSTPPSFDYEVEWTIGDTSQVQYFRVYWSFDGATFALAQDTIPPAQTTEPFSVLIPVAAFGVSVVNTENVEGAMVVEPTP